MNRRTLLKTGSLAAIGSLALNTTGCGDKEDVEFYIATVSGTLEELKPLLPAQAALLTKGISIAKSFNQAYQDGKFDSAMTIFENLVSVINEVIAAAGIGVSDSVKVALAVAGVAIRAIAVLLKRQAVQPLVAKAVKEKASASMDDAKRVSLIESLANSKEINALFEASKP